MGRKHSDVQTDSYLEELTERTVEFEAETQTDFLLDRPQSPLFMAAKVGCDQGTQIEHGELFDFDREVGPVLEVLVGKTLEQGMMEVLEEEELLSIRRRQAMFEQMRQAELLEVQRMESAEKRREEEKERRVNQEKARSEEQLSAFMKAHSRVVARNYLGGLRHKVLDVLEHAGLFRDPVELVVESEFMPWLVDQVVQEIGAAGARQRDVQRVVEACGTDIAKPHRAALAEEKKRRDIKDKAELVLRAELAEQKRLEKERAERIKREQQALLEFDELREKGPEPDLIVLACVGVEEPAEEGQAVVALCKNAEDPEAEPEKVAIAESLLEQLRAAFGGEEPPASINVKVHPGVPDGEEGTPQVRTVVEVVVEEATADQ